MFRHSEVVMRPEHYKEHYKELYSEAVASIGYLCVHRQLLALIAMSLVISMSVIDRSLPARAADSFDVQLNSASEKLNTGMRYWIELNRGGVTSHVTQKEKFITGDKIRFHLKPNIDGFAYIVLRSGSRGERTVLFPIEGRKDDNCVRHGTDYAIPDDFLEFDAHPGLEKVSLLLSRQPINTDALLTDAPETVVLKSQPGSKDLVPAKIKVVYGTQETETTHNHVPAGIDLAPTKANGENVTIIKDDPDSVLHVDIDLEHTGT